MYTLLAAVSFGTRETRERANTTRAVVSIVYETSWRETAAVVVVFTLNRSFYPTTSVHPVSVLLLHPREIHLDYYVVTDDCCETVRRSNMFMHP